MRKISCILLALSTMCCAAFASAALVEPPGIHVTTSKAVKASISIQSLHVDQNLIKVSATGADLSVSPHYSAHAGHVPLAHADRSEVRPVTIAYLRHRDPGEGDDTDYLSPGDDDGLPLVARS